MREIGQMVPAAGALLASVDLKQLATIAFGPKVADFIDFGQPTDIANLGAEDKDFVFSFAARPDAEGRLGELEPRYEGPLGWIPKKGARGGNGNGAQASNCLVTAAVGRASTRIICGESEEAVRRSARWLALKIAGEPSDADAWITVPGTFLRNKTDRASGTLGDATARLGNDAVTTFIDEIDTMDGALRLQNGRIDLEVTLHLAKHDSLIGRVLATRAAPSTPPPSFYRLPSDSLLALHTRGALAEDIAPLRKALLDDLSRTLAADGYRPDSVTSMREALEGVFLTGGPLVVAAGVAGGEEKAEKALATVTASRSDGAAKSAARTTAEGNARAALTPWVLFEVDSDGDRLALAMRDLVKRVEESEKTRTPGAKASKPKDPDGENLDVKMGKLDPKLKLPAGTQVFDVIMKSRKKPVTVRQAPLFVVPKGTTTWIGYSEDVATIASRLRTVLDDTTDVGTLAKSADAAQLRRATTAAAGFTSLTGLFLLAADRRTDRELSSAAETMTKITQLQSHGTSTVVFFATSDAPPSAPATLTLRTQAERAFVSDLAMLLMN